MKVNERVIESWWGFKSRLFWRIAAGLFASILIIEVALLLYSWFTERERMLDRLDETLHTVSSTLDVANPAPQLNGLISSDSDTAEYQITGFVYLTNNVKRSAGGNTDLIERQLSEQQPEKFNSATGDYIRLISLKPDLSNQERSLWLHVDASSINEYMKDYVARIVAMVILISLFVTGACLVILKPVLINPLLRLDRLLIRGQKQGIRSANADKNDLNRSDELGRVFRSFELLRNQLVESEIHSTKITDRFEEFSTMGADCFWEIDRDFVFTYAAGDTKALFSYKPEEIEGQTFNWLLTNLQKRIPEADSLYQRLIETGHWEGAILPERDNGKPVTVRVSAVPLKTSSGLLTGFRGTIEDITKETELANELIYQATHDELTRLYNRRAFASQLQKSIDDYSNDGKKFSLIAIDLDHFKTINDSAGHAAGDALLKSLADILTDAVSEEDIVARQGGDEFCVLVRSAGRQGAIQIAENIRIGIEHHSFIWGKQTFSTSASIGVAEVNDEIATLEGISIAADTCCIAAKNTGKNQLKVYGEDDLSGFTLRGETEWIARILNALKVDGFSLFRQSIVPVDQSQEEHFEILLRMHDPEGGYYSPADFLPVAERNQLMPKIDKWVVSNAFDWLATQEIPMGENYCMNINLSAASLSDNDFQSFLLDLVAANEALNRFVCFEVTESAAMGNLERTITLLSALRQYGCTIALDDFGTGFSSLSHIRELPLDYIKIDGSFIREISSNELDQAVVKSVADIARVLRIKTVAEFVDSTEALTVLEKLKIDYAQGFLFSKPRELISSIDESDEKKAA